MVSSVIKFFICFFVEFMRMCMSMILNVSIFLYKYSNKWFIFHFVQLLKNERLWSDLHEFWMCLGRTSWRLHLVRNFSWLIKRARFLSNLVKFTNFLFTLESEYFLIWSKIVCRFKFLSEEMKRGCQWLTLS